MDISDLRSCIIKKIDSFESYLQTHVNCKHNIQHLVQIAPTYIHDIIQKFKEFCDKSKASKQQKFEILAYVTQYYTAYKFMQKMFLDREKDADARHEVIQCIIKQFLDLCVNVHPVLEGNCKNIVGSFVSSMDTALEMLQETDVQSNLDHVFTIVEEILCFSMSIAQVGSSKDKKMITGSCQIVLNNMENLKSEMEKKQINLAMRNLVIETYTNSLFALEAKVNLVVLNLCLRAFSDYRSHVQKLYEVFLTITNKTALDFVTSNFDLYMDRLFQIGLFSLACSSINKKSVEIKVLLTNLQFLERELIPAFVAMAISSSEHKKTYANILKEFWFVQVKSLRNAVHHIIEPEAYCKLVLEELNENVERIWGQISKGEVIQKDMTEPFVNFTRELGTMIKTSLNSFEPGVKEQVDAELLSVYNILQELEATINVFLNDTLNTTTAMSVNEKIFKRCKILVKVVKKLWTSIKSNQEESTSISSEGAQMDTHEDDRLKSIIAKSQQIVKNRTITLYPKLNFSTSESRMARSKRVLAFKDSIFEYDPMETSFGDIQRSIDTSIICPPDAF